MLVQVKNTKIIAYNGAIRAVWFGSAFNSRLI
jgi:hypothetical protein